MFLSPIALSADDKAIAPKRNIDYPTRLPVIYGKQNNRRDGRAVEGARLESVYTATYRGFESLSLRHLGIQRDAKKCKYPQVIWLIGYFFVQHSATGFIDIRGIVGVISATL